MVYEPSGPGITDESEPMPCLEGSWPVDRAPGGEKPSEGELHGHAGGGMPLTKATPPAAGSCRWHLPTQSHQKGQRGESNGGGGSKTTRCQQTLITPIK